MPFHTSSARRVNLLAWAAALGAVLAVGSTCAAADFSARLETVGVWNMLEAPPGALEAAAPVAVPLRIIVGGAGGKSVRVRLSAADLWGKPVATTGDLAWDVPPGDGPAAVDVPCKLPVGFYRVTGQVECGPAKAEVAGELGVVPLHRPGLRPDSFFASNTSSIRVGQELRLLQIVGMKVQRTHFQPHVRGKPPEPSKGEALDLDFADQDKRLAESKEAGLWVLPIVGYSFEGANSEVAKAAGMHGPPRHYDEFVNTWEQILRHYPEVTTYEFWNEPWIFGWAWAADAEQYRTLQTQWCRMALKVNPGLRLLAGNSSMFAEDHIEPFPPCWRGLLAGTTHHPYSGAAERTMRGGGQARSIDHGAGVTRRMGLPCYYLTEGGTSWAEGGESRPDAEKNNNVNARKIVEYAVRSALVGAFQTNMQWGIGYGPEWTRPNTTLAVLAYFTEDRPIVADIWPSQELIYGAIFAHPRHAGDAVRRLPRAAELAARWSVPVPDDRKDDATKVAVVWSHTGKSNAEIDTAATLTIADAEGLKAYDCTGRPIAPQGGRLTVPFTEYPVYVVTDALDVVELRRRIAEAEIAGATPVNLYALSLAEPADRPQTLGVRVENQLNRPVRGTLVLDVGDGPARAEVEFVIPPARLLEIPVAWPGVKVSPENEYPVTLTARTDAGNLIRRQTLAVARFARRTVTVDGDLKDWAGAEAVRLDSDHLSGGADLTALLLNPNLERPAAAPAKQRVVARVFTAYDDANVYLAAEVHEPSLDCPAGKPAVRGSVTLPYRT
ncbi:MAG: hypothetical protein IMZ66_03595, partial [Planctomycetes bacterium]|nr:hypothetical protein [Planctomycetota bacterium]